MRYFTLDEFDSPDEPGSGAKMDPRFLEMLDEARHLASVPFHINSGYRSEEANRRAGGVPGSSHRLGLAADIRATSSNRRYYVELIFIAAAAIKAILNLVPSEKPRTVFGYIDTFINLIFKDRRS